MTAYFYSIKIFTTLIILLVMFFSPVLIFAQVLDDDWLEIEQIPLSKEDSIVFTQFLDFINKDKKVDSKPFNPYFLPPVFDGKFGFDISVDLPENPYEKETFIFPVLEYDFAHASDILGKTKFREKAFRDYLRNNMQSIKYSYSDIDHVEEVKEIKPNLFQILFSIDPEIEVEKNIDKSAQYKPRLRYWRTYGSSLLQISQNEMSENWSSGGVSNFNLLSIHNATLNYKKDRIQVNNYIEWKLSFNRNKEEKFKIGEDLFRTYSDFGVKAFLKHWSYSSNIEIKTQLFAHSQGDPKEYVSNFFSPMQVNMGILGMKYQLEKKTDKDRYRKLNLSVDISPLSVQSKWVFNDRIDPTRHGIDEGKKNIIDVGSTLNAKLSINFNRLTSFSSRFRFFTNYEKVVLELENELKFSFSQYFSTRIYFFGIFDDSKEKHKDLGYFQYNQLLSFGFNCKW